MGVTLGVVVLLCAALSCNGLTATELIDRIAKKMRQDLDRPLPKSRRLYNLHSDNSVIIGAPSYPSHLPKAEAILPAHTLIKPSLGMLKSALKFPHRDLENGAGVYGNIDNLGIRYDSKNERLMYSGFRRSPLADLFMERSKEEVSPRLRINVNKKPQKKAIKRMLKIFPAKPFDKVPPKWPVNNNNVIVVADILPSNNFNTGKKKQYKTDFIDGSDNDDDPSRWSNVLYGRPNRNIKRSVDSKLHSSIKTFLFMKKLINKLRGNRRQTDVIIVKPMNEVDLGYAKAPDSSPEPPKAISPETADAIHNLNMFWSPKDDFNHIKYSADAPDLDDYLPIGSKDIENDVSHWWYYNQEDFKPFIE